jgi:hypothetical protein
MGVQSHWVLSFPSSLIPTIRRLPVLGIARDPSVRWSTFALRGGGIRENSTL